MAGRKIAQSTAPEVCPVCGDDVPRNALACPGCGADERSGWRDDAGGYDQEESTEDFDYDEFVQDEFGTRIKPKGLSVFWWIAAIVVIGALVFVYIQRGGF